MKYIPYIFPNGRIALVEGSELDAALEANKEILIFCSCWAGGLC